MKNRIFIIGIIVLISVFVGVTIVVQQVNNPVMKRLVIQQTEILKTQKRIEAKLALVDDSNLGSVVSSGGGDSLPRDKMEERLIRIEQQMGALVGTFRELAKVMGKNRMGGAAPSRPQEDFTKVHEIDISTAGIVGDESAPITIVGYLDLECPFSARFQPVIDEMLKVYPGKVKYAVKHFPLHFHKNARPAAKAAIAAGLQGKYWEMCHKILANGRALSAAKFQELAKEIGLDVEKFNKDLKDNNDAWDKLIQSDFDSGMKVGVRGTPTYYLNGRKTRARDIPSFKKEIDEILNKK